jgi:hypothetical protein
LLKRDWFVARSAVHEPFGHDGANMTITIESTPVIVEVDHGTRARR